MCRVEQLPKDELIRRTRHYWIDASPNRLRHYIEKLLPFELSHAMEQIKTVPCHTLAMLVGFSEEPLLQAICAFKPTRVVLVLNKLYGDEPGERRGKALEELFSALPQCLLPAQPRVESVVTGDTPSSIFRTLHQTLLPAQRAGRPVVVDITGGKKTMVAGAFLFAALTDTTITYVDFDEYDPKERRAVGYTCRIGAIANPYRAFALRDWGRARALYGQCDFASAAEVLIGTYHEMQFEGLFWNEALSATWRLISVVQLYAAWENSDYHRARRLWQSIRNEIPGFQPPTAVAELGDRWFSAKGDDAGAAATNLQEWFVAMSTGTQEGKDSFYASKATGFPSLNGEPRREGIETRRTAAKPRPLG